MNLKRSQKDKNEYDNNGFKNKRFKFDLIK